MESHQMPKKTEDKCGAEGLDSAYASLYSCTSSVSENGSFSNKTDSADSSLGNAHGRQTNSGYPSAAKDEILPVHPNYDQCEKTFQEHYTMLIKRNRNPVMWTINDFKNRPMFLVNSAFEALWEDQDEDGDVQVLEEARAGNDSAVIYSMYMADSVPTLNKKNLDMQTVLHIAAETCSQSTVRLLVTRGCDGALADIWGNTPLHIAAKFGKADAIKALTSSPKKEELSHPRFKVPYKSLPQDNKDQMNHDGKTPLHLAAQAGHIECIKALADCKVDLDARRLGDGYAALHIAIDNGDINSMRVLLEKGADLEVRNYKGETPQQLAYLVHRQDMVDLCVEYGASPNQLLFAETEPMDFSDEYMDSDDCYDDLSENLQRQTIACQ